MKKIFQKSIALWVFLGLLVVWECVVKLGNIPLYVLPAPSQILKSLIVDAKSLMGHALVTTTEALTGMGIALLLGGTIGIAMDAFPLLKRSIYPILVVTQTVPMIVLAPIFIIYLGFGAIPKILTVVLMCFFPIVISFSDRMGQLNEQYTHLIRSYGGNKKQVYTIAKIPAALPALFSGLKVAATYSIGGAVVGEWIASQSGLGYYLIRVKNAYMLDKVFACVVVIVLLSLAMNGFISLCERWVLPQGQRKIKEKRK